MANLICLLKNFKRVQFEDFMGAKWILVEQRVREGTKHLSLVPSGCHSENASLSKSGFQKGTKRNSIGKAISHTSWHL